MTLTEAHRESMTTAVARKLPFATSKMWPWRWLVFASWKRLHRVATYTRQHEDDWRQVGVEGTTVCGLSGDLLMPGFQSRLGLARCAHCCDRLGVPRGIGAPYNEGIDA